VLNPEASSIVQLPSQQRPLLVVIIDMEAEFDWTGPLSRSATGVRSVRHQLKTHSIFERYGIKPVYVVDYAVASQAESYLPLREMAKGGHCEIGAHLQPWANPPFEEDISQPRNSFVGNLPPCLEAEKLKRLVGTIQENLQVTPKLYRAGRFGVGPATSEILHAQGFEFDSSVVPNTDFTREQGPNFRQCRAEPYWFGPDQKLLEIPLTVGYTGLLADFGPQLYHRVAYDMQRRLRLPGLLAHLRLLDRVRMSAEGIKFFELRRLTRRMVNTGLRVFNFTYHSPSAQPGNTPYVRTEADSQAFLATIERFFDFFFGEIGGRATTPQEIKQLALSRAPRDLAIRPTLSGGVTVEPRGASRPILKRKGHMVSAGYGGE
jgi:hypothetical protein